jgi:MEMO1 family protein
MTVRPAVAAGTFYPRDPEELAATVDALLGAIAPDPTVQGVVAPHAGYVYSGPVAATAFRLVPRPRRVVLLGPSHFVPLEGCAVSGAAAWATPLGEVPVDEELRSTAVATGSRVDDRPHARDHAIEVQLPFLQCVCGEAFTIVPIAVGRAQPADVARLLDALETFTVVSTDLSHYLPAAVAREHDRRTAEAVVACAPDAIGDGDACGAYALRGIVDHARRRGGALELLDLRTSADTAGEPERVVGYGAFTLRDVSADTDD